MNKPRPPLAGKRLDVSSSKRQYLGNYLSVNKRDIRVYWVQGDPHQPVEIEVRRIADDSVLFTVRKAPENTGIIEVDKILIKAGKL